MRNKQWYWVLALTAALAATMAAGAQQKQQQTTQKQGQATAKKPAFDPCTGDGLPPSSMTPLAPGSPTDMTPQKKKKTYKGTVTCSKGKCKAEGNSPSTQRGANSNPSLTLSPAGKKAVTKAERVNAPHPSAAEANPFPEAKSRAAQAARQKAAEQPPAQQGVYSSSSQRLPGVNALGDGPLLQPGVQERPDLTPELAKKDDKIGKYYLQTGDWAGAYGRFKEATEANPGDLKAVIGLAIAADHLGKRAEAIRNYKLYLDVQPAGHESKMALKALKRLAQTK